MENGLFSQYKDTLDKLIGTDTADPAFFSLMAQAENQLDSIQALYGNIIYAGLEQCYLRILISKDYQGHRDS